MSTTPTTVPMCTHIKTDGVRCGSPAVSGTDFCYHHSAVKTALGKASRKQGRGEFEPIPFVFPEDRAAMQINYFLLLQAFNEGRVDLKYFKAMMSMLKSMAANLGKSGSLVEDSVQRSAGSGQKNSRQRSADSDQEDDDDPFADLRHLPEREFNAAMRERVNQNFRDEEAAKQRGVGVGNRE